MTKALRFRCHIIYSFRTYLFYYVNGKNVEDKPNKLMQTLDY